MLPRLWKTRQTPMADIFISYASVDRPLARRLADALEARGWSVWWDHRNLRGGQHFDRIIEEAISGARVVIVVWSKASVESGWVRDEVTLALEEQKLVPLRIDMVRLPMRFRNIHTIDFSSWTGETEAEPFQRLVKDLTHCLGPSPPSDKPDHPGIPPAPHPQTAAPVGEDQQPAETVPIAEHSQVSPSGGSPHASTITTQATLTTRPSSSVSRKRVIKYFAAVAAAGSILWGVVVPKDRQPVPTNPPIETTVSKPPDLRPPGPPADAGAAQAALDRGDYAAALGSARPAAEQGDPAAQYILGLLYQNGQGVAQDYAATARWYRKAADQGHAPAQYKVGVLYEFGLGVAQDYAEAARWYRKAVDQGHADAQYNLGLLYKNGHGVPQDMTRARAWMQKAAAAGYENAKKWLARN
jgi:hypothetical protein